MAFTRFPGAPPVPRNLSPDMETYLRWVHEVLEIATTARGGIGSKFVTQDMLEQDSHTLRDKDLRKPSLEHPTYVPTVLDDLQVNVSLDKLPAVNAPNWRTFNYGVGGGITFAALGFAVNNYLEFYVQTTHSTKLNISLGNHIHYTTPTNAAGSKFKFQLDVIAAPANELYAVPTGSPYTAEKTLDGTESGRQNILPIANIHPVNTTISTIYICRLTRVAATSNEYAGEVYVTYNDCHIQKDTAGSLSTYVK